jgi:dihydroorotate dehydrogenase electron transfer subunit
VPANRASPLVSREALSGAFFLLAFRHPEVARDARPGQFVMIKAGLSAEPPLRRPFSILTVDPGEDTFTLFVKAIGQGSRGLAALQPGEVAQCLGPLGRPFTLPSAGEALLVAGGYGVAPFRFMAERLRGTAASVRLFYGGRSAVDLPLLDRLASAGLDVVAATEDGSLGERGRVTVPLERHLNAGGNARPSLYACGPEAMMHAVARIAADRSLAAEVSLDPWMGCGIGTCLGCVVRVQGPDEVRPKYRCACTEGPVFDASRVVWPGDEASRARARAGVGEVEGARP